MSTAGRSCGPCTACCTTLSFDAPELSKDRYVPCKFLSKGDPSSGVGCTGCGIYSTRPPVCHTFECVWLHDIHDRLQDSDRPSECGLIFTYPLTDDLARSVGTPVLIAHEIFSGAASAYRGEKVLKRLTRKYLVLVVWEDQRKALGPAPAVERFAALVAGSGTRFSVNLKPK